MNEDRRHDRWEVENERFQEKFDLEFAKYLEQLGRAEAGTCNGQPLYWAPVAVTVEAR